MRKFGRFVGLPLVAICVLVLVLAWGNGPTQKAHAVVDSTVNLSLSTTGCDSSLGPTTCTAPQSGTQFTVSFNVLSFMAGGYAGYDMQVKFSGQVNYVAGTLKQAGAGVWPDCALHFQFIVPPDIVAGCIIDILTAPNSTYLGTLATMGFACKGPGMGTITLVHGDTNTDLVDRDGGVHSEAADESLTINCVPPTPTPPPVGGLSLDPIQASASGRSADLPFAALALVGVGSAMGAVWLARRRLRR